MDTDQVNAGQVGGRGGGGGGGCNPVMNIPCRGE